METCIDTNVLIYVLDASSPFSKWAGNLMYQQLQLGDLVIDPMVYSEVSVGFETVALLDATLLRLGVALVQPSTRALFNAARAFSVYKSRGGTKTNVLPDFLIGANALDRGATLITRDPARYRTYFPDLKLIAPDL